MPKATDEDKEYFRSLVPADPRVEIKPMFGQLAAFVNGNMFMGLFGDTVGVRLAGKDAAVLMKQEGAGPFGPAERPMSGYVSLPTSWRASKAKERKWVTKAFEHVAGLPPKKKK